MKIALAQFNPTVGDFEGNRTRILEMAREAKSGGADLAVFSELCLCGYPPQDLIERPVVCRAQPDGTQAPGEGCPDAFARRLRRQGAGQHRKACREFRRADRAAGKSSSSSARCCCPPTTSSTRRATSSPRTRRTSFALGAETLGITICEDCWNDKNFWASASTTRDPVAELAGKGSTLLLNISSSPYTLGKRGLRHDMLRAIARGARRARSFTSIR